MPIELKKGETNPKFREFLRKNRLVPINEAAEEYGFVGINPEKDVYDVNNKKYYKVPTAKEKVSRMKETGEIRRPPPLIEQLKTQAIRKGKILAKSVTEDIPFLRDVIPEKGFPKGASDYGSQTEKVIAGLTPFARDVGIYAMGAGVVSAASKIPWVAKAGQFVTKIPKVGGLIAKSIPEALKGGVLGALTADSEEPEEIAKSAGEIGALTGSMPALMKGATAFGKGAGKLAPKSVKNFMRNVGKSVGTVLQRNKATNLINKRHAELQSAQLESGLFVNGLRKSLTPTERKILPYLIERDLPKWARKTVLRNPSVRKRYKDVLKPAANKIKNYLNDSHKFLMENYGNDVGFIDNYIPHIWDIPKNKQKQVVEWFVRRNPHTKKRLISTIREGTEKFNLKPKYDDISDIITVYDQYKIKTVANLKFVDELKNITDKTGVKMLQRVDDAPADWVKVDHPALRKAIGHYVGKGEAKKLMLNKVPVKVHPEIADAVKSVFGQPLEGAAVKRFQAINSTAKYLNLTFSLFHHTALSEAGIAAGSGKAVMKAWNPVRIIKAMKGKNYNALFKNMKLSKDAVKHGLQLGRVMDVEGGRLITKSLKMAEQSLRRKKKGLLKKGLSKLGIGATKIRKPYEFNDKFLWSYMHPSFKLGAFEKLSADMLKKYPNKSATAVKREVAQFVNDTFGGQSWELLTKSPKWRQLTHSLLLSPDWTLSTARQALSPLGVGAVSSSTKAIREELGRDFWRKAIVYFGGGMNLLNYSMTKAFKGKGNFMWDNPPGRETHLFTGYFPDGTEKYLRWGKQFRELPEFLANPVEVAGRKMSPVLRMAKAQMFPHPVWQEEFAEKEFWNKESLAGRAKTLGKGFLPYSALQQAQRPGFHPEAFAMPVSKGMTYYRAKKYLKRALKKSDTDLYKRTLKAATDSGIPADDLQDAVIRDVKAEKSSKDRKTAQKIINKLNKYKGERRRKEFEKIHGKEDISFGVLQKIGEIIKDKTKAKKQSEKLK